MKNNKGITLIALVITIIVLIILAGISISILMGEDGLITKAKQGSQNYQNAAIEEQEMLNNFYGDFASGVAIATGDLDAVTHIDNDKAATSDKILKDYQAYVNGVLVTGTMNNYSSNPEKITLTAEQKEEVTLNINPGYHDKITVDASAVYNAGQEDSSSSFPILSLKGHTFRVIRSANSYAQSTGYTNMTYVYFDGNLVYSGQRSGSSDSATLYNKSEGINPTDGAYVLRFNTNCGYDGSAYVHSMSVTLNGYSLYSSGNVSRTTGIDSGTITI